MSIINPTGRNLTKSSPKTRKRRVNEAPFHQQVMDTYGRFCHVPGCSNPWVQAAHIWSKGQGGPTQVENGIPLCQKHHVEFDSSRLRLNPDWLTVEQIEWLGSVNYVRWDSDGQPVGRGWARFAPQIVPHTADTLRRVEA